ncbi:hypothetical protein Ptr902_09892 [Pyrenophora tritici-repentis]|uniref:Uncharacterized protein n=1 Tax=Pyrenophora tritici-repentis TaxID=45151 RepID=A0A834RKJ1_9PLEO|nr:hypothetical protein PtrM4_046200 [Pyrenophora tritici-repentis]KAI2478926.1 hypothetical protein Ptr902_09892 [Pyrenophora tritici-repentis]
MPLKLLAAQLISSYLLSLSLALVVATVTALLPLVGAMISSSTCDSKNCDSNVGTSDEAVAWIAAARALRGD